MLTGHMREIEFDLSAASQKVSEATKDLAMEHAKPTAQIIDRLERENSRLYELRRRDSMETAWRLLRTTEKLAQMEDSLQIVQYAHLGLQESFQSAKNERISFRWIKAITNTDRLTVKATKVRHVKMQFDTPISPQQLRFQILDPSGKLIESNPASFEWHPGKLIEDEDHSAIMQEIFLNYTPVHRLAPGTHFILIFAEDNLLQQIGFVLR
jgi:hypothetical protein